jgi:formimidoylglutamate deiminase
MAERSRTVLFAPRAWIGGRWRERVRLTVGADGCFEDVAAGVEPGPHATRLPGPVLPGVVDAHSHAFQRAFAGLAERREAAGDDFWSWRDRMYAVAARIEPDSLRAIAAKLDVELLRGGYTQVCEFHYLHHRSDGARYPDPFAMSRALADAAVQSGIGLTVLPVLYERAGFGAAAVRDDQRRFATTVEDVLALRDGVRSFAVAHVSAGLAVHSLRAARPESIARLLDAIADDGGPIHVHAAEQRREVEECVAHTGARPIEWLAAHASLDARWQLVHATHATPAEIDAVARAGAGVVLCPTTEANLGDGSPDLPRWLAAGVPLALGSDSNVTRAWWDEVRCLEYGQRLAREQRNVAARPDAGMASTAEVLLASALEGGARAAGFAHWGLVAGARADLVVLDERDDALLGVPGGHALDALVFSAPSQPVRHVMVAGRWVIRDGAHARADAIEAAFAEAMRGLWRDEGARDEP